MSTSKPFTVPSGTYARKSYKPRVYLYPIHIPIEVQYHPKLRDLSKMLFSTLQGLDQQESGCWATNSHLGLIHNRQKNAIGEAIAQLRDEGFINVFFVTNEVNGEKDRYIKIRKDYTLRYEKWIAYVSLCVAEYRDWDIKEFNNYPPTDETGGGDRHPENTVGNSPEIPPHPTERVPPTRRIGYPPPDESGIDIKAIDKKLEDNKTLKTTPTNSVVGKDDIEESKPSVVEDPIQTIEEDSQPTSTRRKKAIIEEPPKILTLAERTQTYLPIADQLANIVEGSKHVRISVDQRKKWSNEIRKLCEGLNINPARVKRAVEWYKDNNKGEYSLVIESGSSLREKFIKLEAQMERAALVAAQPRVIVRKPTHAQNDRPSSTVNYGTAVKVSNPPPRR